MSNKASNKAGLIFPVFMIKRHMISMMSDKNTKNIGICTSVFIAAVMEYLCSEILEIAGEICKEKKK